MKPVSNYISIKKFIASIVVTLAVFLCMLLSCTNTGNSVYQDKPEVSNVIIDSTENLLNAGMLWPAMSYIDSAYNNFPDAGPSDLWKKYQIKNNFYTYYVIDSVKSRVYADSMFSALKNKEKEFPVEYTRSLFALGNSLLTEKKYNDAFEQFYKARAYTLKNLDSCQISICTYWLGLVKYRQGQFSKALPYFKQSMEEFKNCKNTSNFEIWFINPQSTLNTTALSYEMIGQLDSAVHYYTEALEFITARAKAFPDKKAYVEMAKGVVYGNLGGVHTRIGNFHQAEYFLKQSIKINSKPGFAIDDAQTARMKLARLYIKTNRYQQADSLLGWLRADLIRQHGEGMNVVAGRLNWYELKWQYYEANKDPKSALLHVRKYHDLKDSLLQVNEGLKSTDMEQQFRIAQKRNENVLMEKNNQIKSLSIIVLSVFLIIIAAIAVLITYNLKRYRRISESVMEQNGLLKDALSSLEQSQADNSRIMKIVAHDLRNPIGNITMIVAILQKIEGRSESDTKWLEMISNSAKNSLELVSELLMMNTRSEDLVKEEIDLLAMLEYCVDMLTHKSLEKRQRIVLNGKQIKITGSREKLWRVFSNLITNAIKFSPQESVITLTLASDDEWVLVSVADQGIGIPEDIKDKIFDMFSEAKRLGTSGEQSFGMGLAISKQIVEAHKGRIWYERKDDKGTIFFVQLPLK